MKIFNLLGKVKVEVPGETLRGADLRGADLRGAIMFENTPLTSNPVFIYGCPYENRLSSSYA